MAQTCYSYLPPRPTLPMDCSDDNYSYDRYDNSEKTYFDIFDDLDIPLIPSIQADVAKFAQNSCRDDSFNFLQDIKVELRNHDCMWSTGSSALGLSTSASSSYSDSMNTAVPLAAVTGSTINVNGNGSAAAAPTVVVASNGKFAQRPQQKQQQLVDIKTEPEDDYEQQLQHHSILNSRTVQPQGQVHYQESMKNIPPGTSLLRKSNTQQPQQQQQQLQYQQPKKAQQQKSMQIPKLYAGEFVRGRDQLMTAATAHMAAALCVRPDTPHSLDDDVTNEFRHGVDLSACLMGSNNIPLTVDPVHFINQVTQELQDTSKKEMALPHIGRGAHSLSEVLDVIDKDNDSCYTTNSSASHIRTADSDSEDEESTGYGSSSSTLDDGADLPAELSQDSSNSSHHHISHHHQPSYLHSDHSYTRCKDGMEDMGHTTLETPSDSDEEIDVVNICDKKLPTNPSDKDRRALQTKFSHKISSARIVKTANGVKTIPGRRVSYELPYTPASSSPVKSLSNSSYPSPASTPYQNQYTSKYINVMSSSEKSRKRMSGLLAASGAGGNVISDFDYSLPPSKKNRGKKGKLQSSISATVAVSPVPSDALKRHFSVDDVTDTNEKRHIHNDMERQRRIGLKNLFEMLKKQIPSIKDKERAPKVNILREAAKLCEALTREDQQLNEQKTMLKLQQRKRQEMLARLRAAQRD